MRRQTWLGATVDKSLSQDLSVYVGDVPLLARAEQLRPALAGFPVHELLDAFLHAGPLEQPNARRLVEHCLGHWIATLELSIRDYLPSHDEDPLQRFHGLECGARDALSELRDALGH